MRRWAAPILLLVLLAAGCGGGRPTATGPGDPGLVHVHGLGVNPADGMLYAATHTGLFAVPEHGSAARVGDSYQDTMGFTVVGPDHFLGSGHPDLRDRRLQRPNRPPLLGLIESRDAGRSWRPLSLLGEADFHALAVAHGRVFGYDATGGRFMVTADRRRWQPRATVPLVTFAVSPLSANVVVGATQRGLIRSADQGRRWSALPGPRLLALSWERSDALWGAALDGRVYRSPDAGRTWAVVGVLPGQPEALLAHQGLLYASVHQQGIYQSEDSGRTWQLRHGPNPARQ